jgi:hypothetical protein
MTALRSIIFPSHAPAASSPPPRPPVLNPSIAIPCEPLQRQIWWPARLLPPRTQWIRRRSARIGPRQERCDDGGRLARRRDPLLPAAAEGSCDGAAERGRARPAASSSQLLVGRTIEGRGPAELVGRRAMGQGASRRAGGGPHRHTPRQGGRVPLRVMRSRVEVCVNMFQLLLFDVSSFVS